MHSNRLVQAMVSLRIQICLAFCGLCVFLFVSGLVYCFGFGFCSVFVCGFCFGFVFVLVFGSVFVLFFGFCLVMAFFAALACLHVQLIAASSLEACVSLALMLVLMAWK